MDRKDIGPVPSIWPARPPERSGPRKRPPPRRAPAGEKDRTDEQAPAPGEPGRRIDEYA